ncbi:homeodomain-interacting protein kinase 4 [Dermochelys coriacea]|uniref:homeodomain-interacting protein kinase 4 n=1 Tax=Dermochelys coriacea TaxID=27794 RepID=UPI001CA7D84C|nr:homeodomain-interacting protein kinase 4 [Dermochelys coriacea]
MVTIGSGSKCFDVIEILGKGTFGEVVKSWRRSTGEMVAIKILKNDAYRRRIIKNELKLLQTMAGVDSEESHIIQFHEFFHDEMKFYLVFELLEQNLFDFQKENNFSPLPVKHIRTVTTQVLKALAKLKELSIIHTDLKPENIMLVDQMRYPFRVKVIDFGSASIFNEVRYVKEPYIQSRFYRAPEILLGLPFCEKVDMWSLGCIMAELHLGWPLYPGNNENDQIRYICETQGMPKHSLLNVARKAHHFFKRNQHAELVTQWQLKSSSEYLAETKVKSVERRKYVLKSLEQMESVNIHKMIYPDNEALAEYFDLRSMVELIKRMLTWDSHERITPSAALKHPFISMQLLRLSYELTQYYQLCLRGFQESIKRESKDKQEVAFCSAMEEDTFYPAQEYFKEEERVHGVSGLSSVQRTIDQMDDLSIAEPGREAAMNLLGEDARMGAYESSTPAEVASMTLGHMGVHKATYQNPGLNHEQHQEPIQAYYGSRYGSSKHRKHPRHTKSDTFGNLILLGQQSPGDTVSWENESNAGISPVASSLPEPSTLDDQRHPLSPTTKRAQLELPDPEPQLPSASTWLGGDDWLIERSGERAPIKNALHLTPNRLQPYLQHIASHH